MTKKTFARRMLSVVLSLVFLVMLFQPANYDPVSALTMTYTPSDSYKNSKYYSQLVAVNLTGDQRTDIVNVALSQDGYHEGSSSSDLSGTSSGSSNYTEYGRWFGTQDEWCAMFIAWCAEQAQIPTSIIKKQAWAGSKTASSSTGNFGCTFKSFSSYDPTIGDIAYIDTNNDGVSNHVEIVVAVTESTITTIGGNTNGGKEVYTHRDIPASTGGYSGFKIIGYECPNYGGSVIPDVWYSSLTPVDVGTDFYALIFNTNHWKALTVEDDNNVDMRTEAISSSQVWKFVRQDDGSYVIYNGDKVLDSTGGNAAGNNVYTYDSYVGSDAQQWYIYGESGAYYFRSKATDCVMDVYGDYSEDGTNIQMWTFHGGTAQRFQIWRVVTELTVTPGNKSTKTNFSWQCNTANSRYDVKIWKDALWSGDAYHVEWGASTPFELGLPAGTYVAYVETVIEDQGVMSNVVTFTIEEDYFGQPSLSVTAGGKKSKTEFTWTEVEKADVYHVKIWNGTCWEGDIYHSGWGLTGTSYEVDLPPGYYEAYVDAANDETYQMSNIVSFTVEEEYNPADINQDSQTSVLDVVLLQKYILNLRAFTPLQFTTADINSDNSVNAFDLALLKQLLLDN